MKKVCVLILVLFCFVCTSAFAGGSGNVVQPIKKTTDRYGVGLGFGYNYVNDRMLDLYNYNKSEKNVQVKKVSQIYGKILYGINDNLNAQLKAGACHYKMDFKVNEDRINVTFQDGPYAGLGLTGLYPMENWTLGPVSFGIGFGIEANGYINNVKKITRADEDADKQKGWFYGVDGENSLYLTCKYDIEKIKTSVIPYIGAYQSWVVLGALNGLSYQRASQKYADESNTIQGAFDVLSFGLLLGVDVEVTKYLVMNVEGRFIGETAVTTGATVKF